MVVADFNVDGKLDLLIGAEDGFFYFFDRKYIESLTFEPGTSKVPAHRTN